MAAAAAAGLSLRLLPSASSSIDTPIRTLKPPSTVRMMVPAARFGGGRMMYIRPALAVPEGLSEKAAESIEEAKETCAENPESGECAAAWDAAEELAAAVSHAKNTKSDPLEAYCKDNPETEECRTYDN